MIDVRYDRGIHLPAEGLWLDPQRSRELAFISHAHSDHTARHGEAILTEATSRLMRERMGRPRGREHLLPFRERMTTDRFEIELLPAGHVLGSAQCLVRSSAGTLLYSGDFKLRRGASCEPCEPAHAETLVMETTFGLPRYVFPPAEDVLARIRKFCFETRAAGAVPVLLTWSLGKAQEVLTALSGLPVCIHEAAWKITRIYESAGVKFPPHGTDHETQDLPVVICPPGDVRLIEQFPVRRTAAITGWALDSSTKYRMQVDEAFPLSDHAGYDDLMHYVELVNPRRVFTTHGFAREFARDLRARGVEAWSLHGADQLEMTFR